jgi:hypothetical protein
MLKILTIVLTILASFSAFSKVDKLKFNEDIFDCEGKLSLVFDLESRHSLYPASKIDLVLKGNTFALKSNQLINDLGAINPSRAHFIRELIENSLDVSWVKGMKIIRSSPATNLINPKNCEVLPLADITINALHYKIIIDQDRYERLSVDSQVLFWFNVSLDIEQAMFALVNSSFDYSEVEFDLILGRQFMACWLSSDCRPHNVNELHAKALMKDYDLPTLEQDGIIIPTKNNKITFNESTGLITFTKKIADFNISNVFDSYITFHSEKHYVHPIQMNDHFIKFNNEGNTVCAPIAIGARSIGLEGIFSNHKVRWETSREGSYPLKFPLCWDDEENILQGQIQLHPDEKFEISLWGQSFNLNYYNPLYGGEYYGLSVILYQDKLIDWLFHFKGEILFNHQTVSIDGPLKLDRFNDPQCFRFAEKMKLKLKDGSTLVVNQDNVKQDLYCFKENGSLDKIHYYFNIARLIEEDLTRFE